MKAYVTPQQTLSRAMGRVGDALARHAPEWVEIVQDPAQADVQLLHVTGGGQSALSHLKAPRYAVAQYCYLTAANRQSLPWGLWSDAEMVWSYLPSVQHEIMAACVRGTIDTYETSVADCNAPYYHSPLGIDPAFVNSRPAAITTIGCVTSGYVTGPGCEAIEEVAVAAEIAGLSVAHIGPSGVSGWVGEKTAGWRAAAGLSDQELASVYSKARYVSGLRHVEGFEMPVIEGLACGARPIVFDRPDMRQWYDGHAVFVPECHGEGLVRRLVDIFSGAPEPVTETERQEVMRKFDWLAIATGFWSRLREAMS